MCWLGSQTLHTKMQRVWEAMYLLQEAHSWSPSRAVGIAWRRVERLQMAFQTSNEMSMTNGSAILSLGASLNIASKHLAQYGFQAPCGPSEGLPLCWNEMEACQPGSQA